ncbi:MAG: c-type cytochrome [Opitutus sp.]
MNAKLSLCLVCVGLVVTGCDRLESGRGLRLPKGSAENGKNVFVALNCTQCHTVTGVDLPKPTVAPEFVVDLGGKAPRVRSVGDLMTAIIHPTQTVSFKMRRPVAGAPGKEMPTVNDVMTVSQLVDLVRFLQPRYFEMAPPIDWSYSL